MACALAAMLMVVAPAEAAKWKGKTRQGRGAFVHTGANGVVLISGDRHVGGLYRETAGTPYPLPEITSSGLNQVFAANREPGPNRLGAVYGAANFGTADIDWWEGALTLSVRNGAGEPVRRYSVRLDDLKLRRP